MYLCIQLTLVFMCMYNHFIRGPLASTKGFSTEEKCDKTIEENSRRRYSLQEAHYHFLPNGRIFLSLLYSHLKSPDHSNTMWCRVTSVCRVALSDVTGCSPCCSQHSMMTSVFSKMSLFCVLMSVLHDHTSLSIVLQAPFRFHWLQWDTLIRHRFFSIRYCQVFFSFVPLYFSTSASFLIQPFLLSFAPFVSSLCSFPNPLSPSFTYRVRPRVFVPPFLFSLFGSRPAL